MFSWTTGRAPGLLLALLATFLGAAPVAAQHGAGFAAVTPEIGVFRSSAPREEGENRWGYLAGMRLVLPTTGRLRALGTFDFIRINDYLRIVGNQGGFVYASENILATAGIGYDLIAGRGARLRIATEVGVGWSRDVETGRFGSPRPELGLSDDSFSLGVASVTSLDLVQALASRLALDLSLRVYAGGEFKRFHPALVAGLAFSIP